MELTEDQICEKIGRKLEHCGRNTFLPFYQENTCAACRCNVIRRKHKISKISRTKEKK